MEADIGALSARISRLELLLGGQPQRPCVHHTTRTALSNLRQQIPDEISAAHRAVHLLSLLTTHKAHTIDVDKLGTALHQLEGMESIKSPRVDIEVGDMASLELRVAKLAGVVREEERVVDGLLTEFDAMTTRLNHAVLGLAELMSK